MDQRAIKRNSDAILALLGPEFAVRTPNDFARALFGNVFFGLKIKTYSYAGPAVFASLQWYLDDSECDIVARKVFSEFSGFQLKKPEGPFLVFEIAKDIVPSLQAEKWPIYLPEIDERLFLANLSAVFDQLLAPHLSEIVEPERYYEALVGDGELMRWFRCNGAMRIVAIMYVGKKILRYSSNALRSDVEKVSRLASPSVKSAGDAARLFEIAWKYIT